MRISDWSSDVCSSDLRASGKGTSSDRAGADMFTVDVAGRRGPRRVAVAPNLYLCVESPPRWADDGIALYVIGRDYQVWKIDSRNLTSTRLTTDTARKKLLLVGDASGSTIGSIDGGRTLLVTTRHGQTHGSGFLGVDTEKGETRLLREEDKRYGNIINT